MSWVSPLGNLIFATVADTCPSCDVDHLDLSLAAWNALTDNSPYSVAKIDWSVASSEIQQCGIWTDTKV